MYVNNYCQDDFSRNCLIKMSEAVPGLILSSVTISSKSPRLRLTDGCALKVWNENVVVGWKWMLLPQLHLSHNTCSLFEEILLKHYASTCNTITESINRLSVQKIHSSVATKLHYFSIFFYNKIQKYNISGNTFHSFLFFNACSQAAVLGAYKRV